MANRYLLKQAVLGATFISLAGCLDTGSDAVESSRANGNGNVAGVQERSSVRVAFDPQNQVLPFPNNILFEAAATAASDLDGTLNVPIADPDASSAAVVKALNDLDGFSTIEAWRVAFNGELDASSLVAGETVRVFRMASNGDAYPDRIRPQAVDRELLPDDEFSLNYNPDTRVLKIVPTRALGYNQTFTAVLTNGIRAADGRQVDGPITWSVAKGSSALGLNGDNYPTVCDDPAKSDVALLQCVTHFAVTPLEQDSRFGLTRDDFIMAWGVTTQREDTTFRAAADALSQNIWRPSIPGGNTCNQPVCFLSVGSLLGQSAPLTPGGKAQVWPGTIRLPALSPVPAEMNNFRNGAYAFGNATSRDDVVLSGRWNCTSGSCNSDQAYGLDGNAERPQLLSWNTHPVVLAAPRPDAAGVPARPAGGYPLVIFQHAIQQDRTNALAFADALAMQGFAVIAIDMPLHGLVAGDLEPGDPRAALYAASLNDQLYNSALSAARNIIPLKMERTFYLDLVDGDGNPGHDGRIDSSGTHFLNPSQPLTQRDTLRQGALDLVALVNYLRRGEMQLCGMADALLGEAGLLKTCNASRFNINLFQHVNFNEIHYVGHSVGNIVAAPFLAYDKGIHSVTMLAPTGGIMRTLEGSDTVGPRLSEGLAASGVVAGTEDYYRFFAAVQAAIDSVEPLNHAAAIPMGRNSQGELAPRPVYVAQIGGNPVDNPADLVLPPTVDGRPLAGSTPFINAMGLDFRPNGQDDLSQTLATLTPQVRSDGTLDAQLQIAVNFVVGDHASFLLPRQDIDNDRISDLDPHFEMQRQVGNFLKNRGQRVESIDTGWLAPH